MEKQQRDRSNLSDAVTSETQPMLWVAPLQSVQTFSVAELTKSFSLPPGDDGAGTWTQS